MTTYEWMIEELKKTGIENISLQSALRFMEHAYQLGLSESKLEASLSEIKGFKKAAEISASSTV